jgi:hypothetical protein
MTWAEYDSAKPKCPKCKSKKIEQVYSGLTVKTSKKS